ncbi:MAG: sugar ABC transporter substrate-binding protein [Candidatus Baldrarchaeia archaeon]
MQRKKLNSKKAITTLQAVILIVIVAVAAFVVGYWVPQLLTPPPENVVKLTIVCPAGSAEVELACNTLQERHPEVEFDFEIIEREGSEVREYALVSMAGGEFPDVLKVDSIWMGEFVKAGFLYPIPDEWLGDLEGWPDDWYETTRAATTWDEKVYGIWWDTDTRIWIYNKDFISDEEVPKTWEEEIALQRKLAAEGKPPMIIYTSHWWFDYIISLIYQVIPEEELAPPGWGLFEERDGKLYPIFNRTEVVRALQHMVDMVEAGGYPAFSTTEGDEGHVRCFQDYYSAVPGGGTWAYNEWIGLGYDPQEYTNKIGYAINPYPEDGHPGSFSGGWCYTIPAGSDNKEWAWEFIKIVNEHDLLVELGNEYGYLFPRKSVMDDLAEAGNIPYLDVIMEQMEYSYIRPSFPEWDQFDHYLMDACAEAIKGLKTPKQALDDACLKMLYAMGWA